MESDSQFQPGERVTHHEFGQGVVLDPAHDGYLRAFFRVGERRVPIGSVRRQLSRTERILRAVDGGHERATRAWLSYEAHALPVMESASALTSAKIDLLPHQVVLTHRIATASPRRYLIADEVGLGKTIETALILRELASRGELTRALMVVPAGLVNNWHRELNEVFNLDFEVFGSEGDITDRKTNAFAKHDRLIASIDTLKRPARIKRLLDAPRWDLVVFDEAHHLTASKTGGKVKKTDNYKLAEALKDHSRDLLLLSATPHQGNHFQFWMLVQLLNPTLFGSPEEMLEHRHRLNTVMFRRTKADACQPDGSPLFARRGVHSESFLMSQEERLFYEKLREYLEDGFDLARRQGGQGRALGFLMAIFQKIAASSFAAVRRTMKRRLLMLTLHEAFLRDKDLDIEGRERLTDEARELIHEEFNLARDSIGRSEVDRVLAELKYRLVKKLDEEALELASDPYGSEYGAAHAEEAASAVVELHLPEERLRIVDLLKLFPRQRETKAQKLLDGLSVLWQQNPNEKIVVFATYLGTVDLIAREIDLTFPGQGVAVLRGGDHGAKIAAERRFRQKDGPRVLVCTAAGREGINLQFARILFNFDLPWNPMDVEQRIGRIHRYGQNHTAQVYNLVLSDTIEGRIFLMLDEKLTEIAKTVGKVDDQGNIAEDLRAQILGQLSERLNYDRLYQEALSDPELKRTKVELEAALSNSREAREVVFDLFQDLEGFSLDDYKPYSDVSSSLDRVVRFMSAAVADHQQRLVKVDDETYDLVTDDSDRPVTFTLNRETATSNDSIELMGLDHPRVREELGRWRSLPPEDLGIAVAADVDEPIMLSFWMVEAAGANGERRVVMQPIAVKQDGTRVPAVERQCDRYLQATTTSPMLQAEDRVGLFTRFVEPTLQRELKHKGAANGDGSYSAELIGYVEIGRAQATQVILKPGKPAGTHLNVWFGTNRARNLSPSYPAEAFEETRNSKEDEEALSYGRATVSIPSTHVEGKIDKPTWLRLEFKEDPAKHMILTDVTVFDQNAWVANAVDENSGATEGLLFIHGFNVSFEEALLRTAQLVFDLKFQGIPLAFSWASGGKILNYLKDSQTIEWSIPMLRRFLEVATRELGLTKLHVVAHSMGNRALTRVLSEWKKTPTAAEVNQVVFAAPDVDLGIFKQLVAKIKAVAQLTLYSSQTDRAIKASKKLHAGPRAGDGNPPCVVPGVVTVDVSKAGEEMFGLGHGYFAGANAVFTDLYYLLREVEVNNRKSVMKAESGDYFLLK